MGWNLKSGVVSTGLAMFSMFFGAGNVVFPLAMGQYARDQNFYAVLGMLITSVGVPFIGLLSMTLFDGDYKSFFGRIGKWPGFIISLAIICLIGPFGALPRVIALSFSTIKIFIPGVSATLFYAISCLLIFFLACNRSRILDILGYFLTPLLLAILSLLVILGIIYAPETLPGQDTSFTMFLTGLQEGYKTMDLMAAFFFSSVVILCLKKELQFEKQQEKKNLVQMTLKASCIGASLLALVYVGTSYLAAYNSEILTSVPNDEILVALSLQILGDYGAVIAIGAVFLACLTTAVAVAAVFAEFLHEDIFYEKIGYKVSLSLTLVPAFFIANLDFAGIMVFLSIILQICYPALIVLSVANLMHKLYGFRPVKLPFFSVFLVSIAVYLI